MKEINIFFPSQTSAAISLPMDEPSSSSSWAAVLLSRSPAIDRHNPIITDSRRSVSSPTHPRPHIPAKTHLQKKKDSNTTTNNKQISIPPKEYGDRAERNARKPDDEEKGKTSTAVRKSTWGCARPGYFISPPGSTRYLLGENVLLEEYLSDFGPARKIFPAEKSKDEAVEAHGSSDIAKSASLAADKVVVLRVSLHCRGCERKMRKHLSRMKGVTSFNIDFVAKKVTVRGDITPLEVLSSISKVKNAQLWSPTILASPLNLMSNLDFKNENKGVVGA